MAGDVIQKKLNINRLKLYTRRADSPIGQAKKKKESNR